MTIPYQSAWDILDSTKLKDFMRCPRYCMYRHIFGWNTDNPSNHLIFGRAFHEAMEYLLLHGYDHKSLIKAHELMVENYRKDLPEETDELFEPKTPKNAFFALAAYCDKYKDDLKLNDVLHTEIAGSITIGKDKKIYFRMDSLLKSKATGKVFSLEHKTGSGLWLWEERWGLSTQVGTYTHVLNCLYPVDDVLGVILNSVHFLRNKSSWKDLNTLGKTTKKLPFDLFRLYSPRTTAQMRVWLENVNYYYDAYFNEINILLNSSKDANVLTAFPLNENSCISYGKVCEYQDFCLAWPNPLKKFDQVPLGFKKEIWNPMEQDCKTTVNI